MLMSPLMFITFTIIVPACCAASQHHRGVLGGTWYFSNVSLLSRLPQASLPAVQLHDITMGYLEALNDTIAEGGDFRNGEVIQQQMRNRVVNGTIIIIPCSTMLFLPLSQRSAQCKCNVNLFYLCIHLCIFFKKPYWFIG